MNIVKYPRIPYRSEIDGLRALAILTVVVFHFFPNWLASGYLGVDIFFVISGFLITNQLIRIEHNSIKETLIYFYKRRIKRLFPALFLFLTLLYFFVSFFFITVDISHFEKSLIPAYTFWANIFFWRDGGYFGGNDKLKPLLHIWSLSVEEQFYLISPLTLFLLFKLNNKIKNAVMFGVFGIVVISFVIWLYLNSIGGQNPAFFLLPSRVWQFGSGALLALVNCMGIYQALNKSLKDIFFLMGLALILVGIFADISPQIKTVLVTFGATSFIAFYQYNNSLFSLCFRTKLAVFFGKISYSLYLYHWPISVGLTYYFIDSVPYIYSLLGMLASVFLGWFSYLLIENKFRYAFSFKATILFLFFCIGTSSLLFVQNSKNEMTSLADTIGISSRTHFRCDISSYIPYGASRACILKESKLSNKTIVLLGNSHAQMYAPLVAEVSPDNTNLLLVPLNGCLPTPSINISSKCISMANNNLSSVLNDTNVSSVIIATDWYDNEYIDKKGLIVSPQSLKFAIEDLINKIKSSGKQAILFSPIPIPKRDYASELARMLWFDNISEQEVFEIIKVPRSKFDTEFSALNNYFNQLLGDSYIRIYDEICDKTHCYYGTDEIFYFSDSNHLSKNAVVKFAKSKSSLKYLLNTKD